jgi:predicted phosphodiesterase
MLKCAVSSDLHYGMSRHTHKLHEDFFKKLKLESIDVLFLVGDLITNNQESLDQFFKLLREYLPVVKVIVVRGNHDFWDKTYFQSSKKFINANPMHAPYEVYRHRRYTAYCKPISWRELLENHQQIFKRYDIIHLDGSEHVLTPHTTVVGFDGWYHVVDLNQMRTNDYSMLPENIESAPVMSYLRHKAEKDLDIATGDKFVIGMTHFPPFSSDQPGVTFSVDENRTGNPKFLDPLTDKCDILLVGHNHEETDLSYHGCRILNSGAPYDERRQSYLPQYKVFEVE